MWSWCIVVKSFLGCGAVERFLVQELRKSREIKQMLLPSEDEQRQWLLSP